MESLLTPDHRRLLGRGLLLREGNPQCDRGPGRSDQFFLGRDAERVAEPTPDETEDIEVELVPLADIPTLIAKGDITHSIAIVAFHLLDCVNPRPSAPIRG